MICERVEARRGRPPAAAAERLGDHILDSAWAMLRDEGFELFSIDRLARVARVGKPTIYARFANKQALLTALVRQTIQHRRERVMARGNDGGFAASLVEQTAAMMIYKLSPDGRLIDRLIDWLDEQPHETGDGIREWLSREGVEIAADRLRGAVESGEIRIDAIDEAAHFWLAGVLGHARLAGSVSAVDADEQRAWAQSYIRRFLKAFAA